MALVADLARLYGVTTSNLNQAVQRNRERFPEDFPFRLESARDARFQAVFETIRQRVKTPIRPKKTVGFHGKIELPAKSLNPPRNKRK